ncbi:hypothetical protein M409DRAFT_30170 [Zasmidium cellare ATCC 36951]|uniref:Uncharacterized protein n=1 Tax=Zasmidium cellare ATCC 36951 TaxID=1080233 RepID=A0A6A6BZV1_ZASCE|nr:uncharacterized protein M409DRAFT_30170 [Zasmidium cellare ATCC 36951]KAF2159420.1 hypothetical protein M409DRAFT_30170 [Zasmidium cellare ATCC 36951]
MPDCYFNQFGEQICVTATESAWLRWGRWVLLAIVLSVVLISILSVLILRIRSRARYRKITKSRQRGRLNQGETVETGLPPPYSSPAAQLLQEGATTTHRDV